MCFASSNVSLRQNRCQTAGELNCHEYSCISEVFSKCPVCALLKLLLLRIGLCFLFFRSCKFLLVWKVILISSSHFSSYRIPINRVHEQTPKVFMDLKNKIQIFPLICPLPLNQGKGRQIVILNVA